MKKHLVVIALTSVVICAFRFTHDIIWISPANWPAPIYDFAENPLTSEKIQLGRALFYDPILSRDSTISCASCHSSYSAFTHIDHDVSHGINDQTGTRNAPALMNLAWQTDFMWDGAIQLLDMQALAPLTHPKEMDENLNHVLFKLGRSKLYPLLFQKAFGDSEITGERFLKSITQFMLTLVSADSKYDHVMREEAFFTEQEKNGYTLFQKNCSACHSEPLFTTHQSKNNGLTIDPDFKDTGKMMITGSNSDSLLFKIPSLRNIEYTYPYMHDGRFKKLSQVLVHYASGIQHSPTLSLELQNAIPLNEHERVDIIAFLLTLSDKNFVFNPAYKYPKEIFNLDARD